MIHHVKKSQHTACCLSLAPQINCFYHLPFLRSFDLLEFSKSLLAMKHVVTPAQNAVIRDATLLLRLSVIVEKKYHTTDTIMAVCNIE